MKKSAFLTHCVQNSKVSEDLILKAAEVEIKLEDERASRNSFPYPGFLKVSLKQLDCRSMKRTGEGHFGFLSSSLNEGKWYFAAKPLLGGSSSWGLQWDHHRRESWAWHSCASSSAPLSFPARKILCGCTTHLNYFYFYFNGPLELAGNGSTEGRVCPSAPHIGAPGHESNWSRNGRPFLQNCSTQWCDKTHGNSKNKFESNFQEHGCSWEKVWYFSQLSVVLITCKENQPPVSNDSCESLTSRNKNLYTKHSSRLLGKSLKGSASLPLKWVRFTIFQKEIK